MKGIIWALSLAVLCTSGCSIRRIAVNRLGDALAQGGTTFSGDDDPDLIRDAAPFSLKLMESLLAENPQHLALLRAVNRGFTEYAYAFIQEDADEQEDKDLAAANALHTRARHMNLRAGNYGLRGLAVRHPNFPAQFRAHPKEALGPVTKAEVPFLYWTAVSWGGAIALSKDDPDLVADVPLVDALISRAVELDEAYEWGSIPSFLISFESARKGAPGDVNARIRAHFDRAVQLSHGQLVSPYVGFAESVSVQTQNLSQFKSLLNQALAVDTKARPEWQVENLVMQRRARWLLSRTDQLFLSTDESQGDHKNP